MPAFVLGNQRVYLGGLDLTQQTKSLTLDFSRQTEDATVYGNSTVIAAPTLRSASLSLECLWDPSIDPHSLELPADIVGTVALDGSDGAVAWAIAGVVDSSDWGGSAGDLAPLSLSLSPAVQLAGRGAILAPHSARTASGAGVARQVGQVASGRRIALVAHVTAISGAGAALALTLESDDSSAMTSAITRASLSGINAAGSYYALASGPITDDWWRVTWTITGTSPSVTFVAAAILT